MKTDKNPRGAGAKPKPYRTKSVRVPVPLTEEVADLIAKFKKISEESK